MSSQRTGTAGVDEQVFMQCSFRALSGSWVGSQ
jgi:hypothetical protein